MRTIDADAFADYIRQAIAEQKYESLELDKYLTVADVLETVISELDGTSLAGFKNAPTVDTVPVQHGRWITHGLEIGGHAHASCECTVCGASRPITLFPLNFCPNCGAVMDGKDNALSHKPKSLLEAYMQMMCGKDGNE